MKLNQITSKLVLTILTLLFVDFAAGADMVIIPAITGMAASFPGITDTQIDMILTYPSLAGLFGALSVGFMARYVSKKTLVIIAYVIFIFAAGCGALIDNLTYIIIMRMVVGFICGIVPTLVVGLITESFDDTKMQSMVLGWSKSVAFGFGAILSFASGVLAVNDWHYSYFLYFVSIIVLIMICLFIPKDQPERFNKSASDGQDKTVMANCKMPWLRFLALFAACFCFCIMMYMFSYYISFYVIERSLGDAATAGSILSLFNIATAITGILFGLYYTRIRRRVSLVAYACLAAMFIILYFTPNLALVYIAAFFGGVGYINAVTGYYMRTAELVPPSYRSVSFGIITSAYYIAIFLVGPTKQFVQHLMGISTMQPMFLYIGAVLVVGSVLSLLLGFKKDPLSQK